jgi:omega-6 fatty acid desaturase (delta-12 desaturase)
MHEAASRSLKARLAAYHEVDAWESWGRLLPTLALLVAAWVPLFLPLPVAVRAPLAVVVAAVLLRLCSFAHDWAHGAILRGSRTGRWVAHAIGLIVLAPVKIWTDTHNFHHAHNAQLGAPALGAFPMWTLERYRRAGEAARFGYRFARSPVLIMAAWLLVFVLGLNVAALVRNARKYWSSAVALLVHAALHAGALLAGGSTTWILAVAMPYTLLGAVGAHLFYVQHTYPGARWQARENWSHDDAALACSSYMGMPQLMHWVTGNIGYHHIHHLQPRVPFYRLPEAFAGEAELKRAPDTSFGLRDVRHAFDLALWDPEAQRVVGWSELARTSRRQG